MVNFLACSNPLIPQNIDCGYDYCRFGNFLISIVALATLTGMTLCTIKMCSDIKGTDYEQGVSDGEEIAILRSESYRDGLLKALGIPRVPVTNGQSRRYSMV